MDNKSVAEGGGIEVKKLAEEIKNCSDVKAEHARAGSVVNVIPSRMIMAYNVTPGDGEIDSGLATPVTVHSQQNNFMGGFAGMTAANNAHKRDQIQILTPDALELPSQRMVNQFYGSGHLIPSPSAKVELAPRT